MRLDGVRAFGSRLLIAMSAPVFVSFFQNCTQNGVGSSSDSAADDNHIERAMEDVGDERAIT